MNGDWRIGILLSSNGFEGIQFFDVTPETQEKVLSLLPNLYRIFGLLDMTIKRIERIEFGCESKGCNYS
jgi:hypothetical protein